MPLNINDAPAAPSKQRPLIPAGQCMARLVQVIDMGLQEQHPYKGEEKPPKYEIRLTFEFPDERIDVDGESKPMWKSETVRLSSDERSTCYKWYNKLDPNNTHRGDWSKLIDTPCAVLITHSEGKGKNQGKVFDNISDVMPLMKGVQVPPLENDPVVFDLGSPDLEVFNSFPEWMQNLIKANLEFDGSKLQTALEGRPTKYTARAENDGPDEGEEPPTAANPAGTPDDDDDDPW